MAATTHSTAAQTLAAILGMPLPAHAAPADPATARRLAEALRRVAPTSFPAHPWAKLTNQEWAALRPWLTGGDRRRRGRPPTDLRRIADAISGSPPALAPGANCRPSWASQARRTGRCGAGRSPARFTGWCRAAA